MLQMNRASMVLPGICVGVRSQAFAKLNFEPVGQPGWSR
jgi:hypothetical protein